MESGIKKLVLVGLVGVTGACATGLGWQMTKGSLTGAKAGKSAESAATLGSSERALSVASPGAASELEYAVDFETTVEVTQASRSRVTGTFSLLLVEREPDHGNLVMSGKLKDVLVVVEEGDAATREAIEAGLTKDLEQSFVLVLENSGKVLRFGSSPTLSAGTESVLRAAVSSLQYLAGPGSGTKTWQTSESDHYGAFTASYRALSHDRVEKQKTYTKLALPTMLLGSKADQSMAKGRASFTLAEAGRWPLRVESKDELATGQLKVGQRFTLSLQGRRPVKRLRADLSQTRMSELGQIVERAGSGKGLAYKRSLVAGASYRDLVAELQTLGSSEEDDSKRDQLVQRLAALFELEPREVEVAARALREGSAGTASRELLGALSSSPGKEAKRAVDQLAADRQLPAELRSDTLANITIQPQATSERFATLSELTRDPDPRVKQGAILALGSAAEGAQADPALASDAERATNTLKQGYEAAQTPAERALYLKALGNSGSAQAFEAAKVALASPDPGARREGVRALRLIPGEEVDQLIAQVWLTDEDAGVREAAPFAANYRPLSTTLTEAALTALAKDPHTGVRLRTLSLLAENVSENPAFAQALKQTAQGDPSQDVREAAQRYLHGG
jgi:hypothetical protein